MLTSSLIRTKPVAVRSVCSFTPTVRTTPRVSVRQQISRVAGNKNVLVKASSEQAVEEQVHVQESVSVSAPAEPTPLPAAMLKLVISHSMAGAFIGTKGMRLSNTVATSGANIRVASRQALFSGTNERTAVVSGSPECVSAAMALLLQQKLVAELHDVERAAGQDLTHEEELAARLTGQEPVVVLLAVSSPVSEIFQAEQLASIGAQSGAELQLSAEEYGTEKVVSVSGIREQVLRALDVVMPLLSAQPQYAEYMEQSLVSGQRSARERTPREPRTPREKKVREPREPREPRPDDIPEGPFSLETMQTSSQLFLSAEIITELLSSSRDAVSVISESTGTQISCIKARQSLPMRTVVRIRGPTASVASAMEQLVTLVSTPKQ